MQSNDKPISIRIAGPESAAKWHSRRNRNDANQDKSDQTKSQINSSDNNSKTSPNKSIVNKNDKSDKKTNNNTSINSKRTKGMKRDPKTRKRLLLSLIR